MLKTLYDVRKLLMQYGSIIYTGDKRVDLEWMEQELYELFKAQLIDVNTLQSAIGIIQEEKRQFEKS